MGHTSRLDRSTHVPSSSMNPVLLFVLGLAALAQADTSFHGGHGGHSVHGGHGGYDSHGHGHGHGHGKGSSSGSFSSAPGKNVVHEVPLTVPSPYAVHEPVYVPTIKKVPVEVIKKVPVHVHDHGHHGGSYH